MDNVNQKILWLADFDLDKAPGGAQRSDKIIIDQGKLLGFNILKTNHETFGKHISIELNAEEGKSVLIDSGLGHGFVATDDNSVVAYILSSEFNPIHEMGLNPLDPELGIDWQIERLGGLEVVLSEKDLTAPNFRDQIEPKKNEKSNES